MWRRERLTPSSFSSSSEPKSLPEPTRFSELNAILEQLVSGARDVLGENLVGAYLQGSFAIGDADEHSDVDFLIVLKRELTEAEQGRLGALQERLFALSSHWAQHLEGSYVPRAHLRQLDRERRPWFYFDNGATRPEWDNHDNTAVVRWSLRERGIVLAGPDPKTLVDPVTADELRADALRTLEEWEEWLPTLKRWSARLQPLAVLSYCRILHTIETGTIGSKGEAGEWALEALAPEWRGLVRRALDDRPDPWAKVGRNANPAAVAETCAFADYAAGLARQLAGTRPAAR
jgi:predicted nucleotidyltransferase